MKHDGDSVQAVIVTFPVIIRLSEHFANLSYFSLNLDDFSVHHELICKHDNCNMIWYPFTSICKEE